MPGATKAQLVVARDFLERAERRIDGAAAAAARSAIDPGEFDNNFDGVVTAIFHIVDAYELALTGIKRRVGDAEQATRIQSVLAELRSAKVPNVPPGSRLIDLQPAKEHVGPRRVVGGHRPGRAPRRDQGRT
jgi:hypothetical protein